MTDKENLELDDDFLEDDELSDDGPAEATKVHNNNLSKRLVIDSLLEERRLQRQLADYDFEL